MVIICNSIEISNTPGSNSPGDSITGPVSSALVAASVCLIPCGLAVPFPAVNPACSPPRGGARPEGFGEGLRGLDERVADQHEPGLGMGGDGGGMDLADAPRAYHCYAQHVVSFLGVRCPLGVEAGLLAPMPVCWAYSRLPALQRRQTATGPANRVQGQQTGLFRGLGQGAGTMMSRTRASRSASAARNWRSVLRVGPNSSNSSTVMPSGS